MINPIGIKRAGDQIFKGDVMVKRSLTSGESVCFFTIEVLKENEGSRGGFRCFPVNGKGSSCFECKIGWPDA